MNVLKLYNENDENITKPCRDFAYKIVRNDVTNYKPIDNETIKKTKKLILCKIIDLKTKIFYHNSLQMHSKKYLLYLINFKLNYIALYI